MKLSLLAAGVAGMTLVAPAAAQESGWYGDVGYQFLSVDEGGIDADLGAITGHVGYNFTPNLAAEGEVGFGVSDEDVNLGGGINASVGVNYLVGAYGRVQAPLGENLSVFARAGVVNAEVEAEAAGVSASDSETGAGYGVGGEYLFDGQTGIRADYTRYDIEDSEIDAFMIGLSRKF